MANRYDERLQTAITNTEETKEALEWLKEQRLVKLLRYEPVFHILLAACDFLISNIKLLRKQVEDI